MRKNSKRIILEVRPEFHQQIKKRALERGMTMRQYVLYLMSERLKEELKYE